MDRLNAKTIVESLPFPVVAVDRELQILIANHGGLTLVGRPSAEPSDSRGASLLDSVPASEHDRFRAAVAALYSLAPSAAPHSAVTFEVLRRTPVGEQPCQLIATRLCDEHGGIIGCLFASREFGDFGEFPDTDRQAEQEEARMDVARQLAATLNHEINNPLFVVSATLEDLLAETSNPAEQRRLKAALDSVWRVSSSVKKLSEIRQLVSTPYVGGLPMIDLEASQFHPDESRPHASETST
jgi:signal transduction histidine kinase